VPKGKGGSGKAFLHRAGGIDLLITDVVMPEMSGRDLADQLPAHYPHIASFCMSGYAAGAIVHRGVRQENMASIQKSFSIKGLTEKVRAVLHVAGSAERCPLTKEAR